MIMTLMAGAVAQTLSPCVPAFGQVKAPVLLAIVIYYALNRGVGVTACAALLAGFLQDALHLIPLGYSPAVFVTAGWLIGRYRRLVNPESPATPLVFGAVTGAAATLALTLLLAGAGLVRVAAPRLPLKLFGSGISCMVTTLAVFLLVGALERRVGNVRTAHEVDGTIEY